MSSGRLNRWRALLAMGCVLACLPAGAPVARADDYQHVERSIVHLWISFSAYIRYTNTQDKQVWTQKRISVGQTCTGSFVSADGAILTAGHCLDTEGAGDRIATQFLRDNDFTDQEIEDTLPSLAHDEVIREVIAFQPPGVEGAVLDNDGIVVQVVDFKVLKDGDVALLRLNNFSKETPALIVARTKPELLSRVTSIGFPASVSQVSDAYRQRASFKSGEVSSFQTYQGTPFTEISAAMSGGMSGGPTVNAKFEIVGVNSYGPSGESQSFNFVTDTAATRSFLISNGVALVSPTPSATPTPPPAPDASTGTGGWLLPALGVAALALVIAAVVIVVVRRNRSQTRPPYYAQPGVVGTVPGVNPPAGNVEPRPLSEQSPPAGPSSGQPGPGTPPVGYPPASGQTGHVPPTAPPGSWPPPSA